jgi:organic radical activating enzyme
MSDHWFPVPSDNACLLKWSWSSLYLWTNTSSSCHRVQNVKVHDIEQFHNTPEVIEDRRRMLAGQWPGRGCESCRDQEQYSGFSDRKKWLSDDKNKKYVPLELYNNPTQLVTDPTMVEIYFNNKCNLKCLYCGPFLSSAWQLEEQQFSNTQDKVQNNVLYDQNLTGFYRWMEKNYSKVKEFHILGGEPFIQQETFDCIDWMIEHPNIDLDFEIFSNMQIKPELFKRNMEKIKQLTKVTNSVEVTASIDCWGPEAEYIRTGLDLATFKENMEYLIYECPEVIPTMNWTVSSLSIPTTAELVKQVIHWNKTKPDPKQRIAINYNKCIEPEIMDPHIMPPGTFAKEFAELTELNKEMIDNDMYREYAQSIFAEIDSSPAKSEKIGELKKFLDKMDTRRSTDWRRQFPWLVDIQ